MADPQGFLPRQQRARLQRVGRPFVAAQQQEALAWEARAPHAQPFGVRPELARRPLSYTVRAAASVALRALRRTPTGRAAWAA